MSAIWHIQLLGALRVSRTEKRFPRIITRFRTHKTGALLAYLAFYGHRAHSREELVELWWPDADPKDGRNNLSVWLSSLRHQLEPPGVPAGAVIQADRLTVRLNPDAFTTDVADFQAALQAADRAPTEPERIRFLQEAIDGYGGLLLPGHLEDWVLAEQERLSAQFFESVRTLATLLERAGDREGAIRVSRRALSANPPRLEAHEGREELQENLAALQAAGPESERPVPPVPDVPAAGDGGAAIPRPVSLPPSFTPFFGRDEELAGLDTLLEKRDTRLVTLTGSAGNGKTRLALEAARRLEKRFAGAVGFAELADLSDASRLPDRILGALGEARSPSAEPLEQAVAALSRAPSLLVLDNFEHLVEEGAPVVQTLLGRVPALTVLVTSRRKLELSAEREFLVAPLPTPAAGDGPERLLSFGCVQLFLDRAQRARPDFQIKQSNAAAVAELMRRLEGIPLAIELAAARAQVLTPAGMLEQLQRRFAFLKGGKRDVGARHRTLRAALDWSFDLLAPELQRFFARLSVFRGGWTAEAAAEVCEEADALDALERLRECSLVLTEEQGSKLRFSMLETLREYGQERLAERGEETRRTCRRHLHWCLALTEREGEAEAPWLERLEREHDNLRAGLLWALEGEPEAGLRLAGSLGRFFEIKGHWTEGRTLLRRALERAAEPSLRWARAMVWTGYLAWLQGDHSSARALLEQSLAVQRALGDRQGIADSLHRLGIVVFWLGDTAGSLALIEESLSIRRGLGNRQGVADALDSLGLAAFRLGDNASALALIEEGLNLRRALGDLQGVARSLNSLAHAAFWQGDHARARALIEQSLDLSRTLGSNQSVADSLHKLGIVACCEGDYATARALIEQSLSISRELGDRIGTAEALNKLGIVACCEGDFGAARALIDESLRINRELGDRIGMAVSLESLGMVACCAGDHVLARTSLEESLSIRRAQGDRRGIAVSLDCLGIVTFWEGDYPAARALFEESLGLLQEPRERWVTAFFMNRVAGLTLSRDQNPEVALRAAGLLGMLEALCEFIDFPLPPGERALYERSVAAAREVLGEEVLAAVGAAARALARELTAAALEDAPKSAEIPNEL